MKAEVFKNIENYMLLCMNDSAHDKEHIYRVLYMSLDIAKYETEVNLDVLIISCLLHDIGREEQNKNPELCHAKIGSEKAYDYLLKNNYSEEIASQVRTCILTHRFRSENQPKSIEAKILFDADKLDATGTLGIARTLLYKAQVSEPLYSVNENGIVSSGIDDNVPSFFQEYKYKLEKLYNKFYTERATQIAKDRQASAIVFYNSMLNDVQKCYATGTSELARILK